MFSQNYTTVTGNIIVSPSQAIPDSMVKDLEILTAKGIKETVQVLLKKKEIRRPRANPGP